MNCKKNKIVLSSFYRVNVPVQDLQKNYRKHFDWKTTTYKI
jgi:hypothetical protein